MSRSYYRCTNPRCNAKKQVERSIEDPETLIVTYEGLHLHYTYSHFLLPQTQNPLPTSGLPLTKKSKIQTTSSEDRHNEDKKNSAGTRREQQQEETWVVGADKPLEGHKKDSVTTTNTGIRNESMQHLLLLEEEQSPQGLLEDIVPLLVRKPSSSATSSNEPSSPSQISSPSYSSSSFLWSPTDFYFDVGILSNIM